MALSSAIAVPWGENKLNGGKTTRNYIMVMGQNPSKPVKVLTKTAGNFRDVHPTKSSYY